MSRPLPLLCVALLGVGCATASTARKVVDAPGVEARPDLASAWAQWPGDPAVAPRAAAAVAPAAGALQETLRARASQLVGVTSLRKVTHRLPDDCTGLVRLVYEAAGVDLMAAGGQRGDSGVTIIHRLAANAGALHRRTPRPGDLVFFTETYDRNRDGKRNDGLTHVGVVETVDRAGRVTFVHRGGAGVSRSTLTVATPSLKRDAKGGTVNQVLRPARRGAPAKLTGELFAGYASAERLEAAAGGAHGKVSRAGRAPVSRR